MISASATPETWQAGPASRPCEGSYYQHPMSAADYQYQAAITTYGSGVPAQTGPIYYDDKGHCVPYSATILTDSGWSIWTLLFWAGLAYGGYYVWTHRKTIF